MLHIVYGWISHSVCDATSCRQMRKWHKKKNNSIIPASSASASDTILYYYYCIQYDSFIAFISLIYDLKWKRPSNCVLFQNIFINWERDVCTESQLSRRLWKWNRFSWAGKFPTSNRHSTLTSFDFIQKFNDWSYVMRQAEHWKTTIDWQKFTTVGIEFKNRIRRGGTIILSKKYHPNYYYYCFQETRNRVAVWRT